MTSLIAEQGLRSIDASRVRIAQRLALIAMSAKALSQAIDLVSLAGMAQQVQTLLEVVAEQGHAEKIIGRFLVVSTRRLLADGRPIVSRIVVAPHPGESH